MAAATYTTDLTDIVADSSNTNNWAALGGGASGLNIETDYFIEGTRCVSKNAWAGAAKGMVEDTTNTALTSGDLGAVYTWVTHATPGSLAVKASGGIAVCMGSASNALNRYNYAGSDTIDYGAPWICAVVDPENATASSGTVTPANIDTYGAEANLPVDGPTKGAPFGIDEIRQGRSYDCTVGDATTPATFVGAAAKNDLLANRYGQFQGVPGIANSYTMQCRFGIGTAATSCYFEVEKANISLNDLEFVDPDFQLFEVVNSGTTCKWTNVSISAVGTNAKGDFLVTSSLLVELTSCAFTDMNTFTFDGNTTVTGSTFQGCGLVTQGSGTIDSCIFVGSTASTAITADDINDLTDNDFTIGTSGHAVELTGVAGTYAWSATTTGYDAGSTGNDVGVAVASTTGDETLHITATTGTFIINVEAGATTPSVSVGNDAVVVNVIAGQVNLTLTGLVPNTEVRILEAGTTTELDGVEDSGTSFVYTYTYVASTYVDIIIHKADYKHIRIEDVLLGSGDASLPIQQIFDRNYSNP